MNKIIRLLMILGMVSMLSSQSQITVKNTINGYSTVGDTVTLGSPYLFSLIKSDDWFATIFVNPSWNPDGIEFEELFYKPYSDKFTLAVGQLAIPLGSNIMYLDFTRQDMFTYQTSENVGLIQIGRGLSLYGGLGNFFIETYYGSHLENEWEGYSVGRVSYDIKGQSIAVSADNKGSQIIDVVGWNKYIDYIGEYSLSDDYQWVRAVIKPTGKPTGISLLAGYETFDGESKPLYGLMWAYDGERRYISTEFSGEGDIKVKLGWGLDMLYLGGKEDE